MMLEMADTDIRSVPQQLSQPIKILKWKVKRGYTVSIGSVILLYTFVQPENEKPEQKKLKSTVAGAVSEIVAQENSIINPGEVLFNLKPCNHPTVMNDMCAECGADLRKNDLSTSPTASVPMVHSIPDLKVSEEQAQQIGKADNERLIRDRKLVLLVDLDQTLIHTTNDNIPPNIKDVYHFQLYGPNSPWYHTRLRPGTHEFLENICSYFELHICTFGARNYAHTIAMFLDEDQRLFSNRILSRDECFDPTSKKANLKALFPCGDNMVCIIDDREDVWSHAANLIHVKPYHFFQHTGDINAPPGLDKHEDDNKSKGVDLSNIKSKHNSNNETPEQENNYKDSSLIETEDANKNEVDDKSETNETTDENEAVDKSETSVKNVTPDKNEEEEEEEETKTISISKKDTDSVDEEQQLEGVTATKLNVDSTSNNKETTEENNVCENNIDEEVDVKETNSSSNEKETETNDANMKEEPKEDGLIEIEDPDDYLLYLEEILKRIHDYFYDEFDKLKTGEVPDLKKVIPTVRSQVLKGTKLVFSGLVPTHMKLEQSKAYLVAKSLGAEVTQNFEADTTHLVAVRPGTAKVNEGKRKKNLRIVTPDWLWCCAERWEHVNEKIYRLNSKGSKNRHPPPHCSSPEHSSSGNADHENRVLRKRTPSGRFMDTINPLMSFSTADIASMDKEVEDMLESSESSEDETLAQEAGVSGVKRKKDDSSSSSDESLTAEYPKGYKRFRAEALQGDDDGAGDKLKTAEVEEVDADQNSQDSVNSMDSDEVEDGEWKVMGATLEREFLAID